MHAFTGTKLSNLVLVSSGLTFNVTSGTTYFIAVSSAACPWRLLDTGGSVNGSTVGATGEPGDPAGLALAATKTIWYRATAPVSGPVEFDTFGSAVDTTLGVFTGPVGNQTQVALNDDAADTTQSKVTFS